MTMISESSFLSTSSQQEVTILNSFDLQKIETDVFNRIVHLKNQKIQLLQHLSQCMDKKYQTQAELIHHLQIKKKKEQNLANRQEYEPIIRKNVELNAEIQELQRQVMEKSARNAVNKQKIFGEKSRTKSVYDLAKSKQVFKSTHSKSRPKLQNSKSHHTTLRQSNNYNISQQDQLIDQIIQQRKLNNAMIQILQQQNVSKESISFSQQLTAVKQKQQLISKLLLQQEESVSKSKISKSFKGSSSKSKRASQQKLQKTVLPVTVHINQVHESDLKVQIRELLRYIDQQQNEKRMLYQQLIEFKNQMQQIRQQNERIKQQLKLRNID